MKAVGEARNVSLELAVGDRFRHPRLPPWAVSTFQKPIFPTELIKRGWHSAR